MMLFVSWAHQGCPRLPFVRVPWRSPTVGERHFISFGFGAGKAQLPSSPPRKTPCLKPRPPLGVSRAAGACVRHVDTGLFWRQQQRQEDHRGWRKALQPARSSLGRVARRSTCASTRKTRKTRRNCVWWRDGTADGEDKLQRGRTRARVSRGAVQALESGDAKQDGRERRQLKAIGGNRFGGEMVRNW